MSRSFEAIFADQESMREAVPAFTFTAEVFRLADGTFCYRFRHHHSCGPVERDWHKHCESQSDLSTSGSLGHMSGSGTVSAVSWKLVELSTAATNGFREEELKSSPKAVIPRKEAAQ